MAFEPTDHSLPTVRSFIVRRGTVRRITLAGLGLVALGAVVGTVAARGGTGGQKQIPTTIEDFFLPGTQPNPDVEQFDAIIGSQNCGYCHSDYGVDIAPLDSWVASVMGQSARDPVWHAALAVANQDVNVGGETCIRCHAPGAWLGGRSSTGTTDEFIPEDFDGINCNFCHRVVNPELGPDSAVGYPGGTVDPDVPIISALVADGLLPFGAGNARYVVDPKDSRRGPFSDVPDNLHGQSSSGNPVELITSPYHRSSEFCGTCHDVSNPVYSRNKKGHYVLNPLGEPHPTQDPADMFPEQRTYSEWLNSAYVNGVEYADHRYGGNDPDGVVSSCQDCHMPKVIAGGCVFYQFGEPWFERPDMPQHSFSGANTWVVQGIRHQLGEEEADAIGLTQERVDAAAARTANMLEAASDMTLEMDGARLKVRIVNESGHKLPSGYPEGRRMWVNVKFTDAKGAIVSEIGAYDSVSATLDTNGTKIYQAKHGTTQEIAKLTGIPAGENFHLALANKRYFDNRIPPRGFSNKAFAAIGSQPVGYSYSDGQHWDDTWFDVPAGAVDATVTLFYQTTTRDYIEFLRDVNVTNTKGQEAYDVWAATGKSAPVAMDSASIEVSVATPGDFDGNGAVDAADLATLLSNWALPGVTDLDGNGTTDAADLSILLGNWG